MGRTDHVPPRRTSRASEEEGVPGAAASLAKLKRGRPGLFERARTAIGTGKRSGLSSESQMVESSPSASTKLKRPSFVERIKSTLRRRNASASSVLEHSRGTLGSGGEGEGHVVPTAPRDMSQTAQKDLLELAEIIAAKGRQPDIAPLRRLPSFSEFSGVHFDEEADPVHEAGPARAPPPLSDRPLHPNIVCSAREYDSGEEEVDLPANAATTAIETVDDSGLQPPLERLTPSDQSTAESAVTVPVVMAAQTAAAQELISGDGTHSETSSPRRPSFIPLTPSDESNPSHLGGEYESTNDLPPGATSGQTTAALVHEAEPMHGEDSRPATVVARSPPAAAGNYGHTSAETSRPVTVVAWAPPAAESNVGHTSGETGRPGTYATWPPMAGNRNELTHEDRSRPKTTVVARANEHGEIMYGEILRPMSVATPQAPMDDEPSALQIENANRWRRSRYMTYRRNRGLEPVEVGGIRPSRRSIWRRRISQGFSRVHGYWNYLVTGERPRGLSSSSRALEDTPPPKVDKEKDKEIGAQETEVRTVAEPQL
ncbi:hypothetical protein F5Y17DRAFT_75151 [Xylariaceae sp. FL0594]|nr:hypothetical protein F5Y17DRAFT_75151 [Xylariaceae sp. FL0594]